MCCSSGYINKTQPNYAQASLGNFMGLWEVCGGKTQPVQIAQQPEAAGGAAAAAERRQPSPVPRAGAPSRRAPGCTPGRRGV